jgi:hypothetical protein
VTFAVSVFVARSALASWATAHGRELTEAEQYAAAKLRLFRAFDEIEDLLGCGRRLLVTADELRDSLSQLGVE